ncbi:hypothetical protein AB4254_11005 [Vibrio breoganii]
MSFRQDVLHDDDIEECWSLLSDERKEELMGLSKVTITQKAA